MSEKEPKRTIDWEAIERAYRAGVLSLREIGKVHDISDTAIRKKAKLAGWERDLSAKVAEKVRTELVRSEFASENLQTEKEIVEAAAASVVQVVRSHRKAITQGQALVELLTKQLIDVAGKREEFEGQIEVLTSEDKSPERFTRLMKAVSLSTHAGIAVSLATATKAWVGLERQAFNLVDGAPVDDGSAAVARTDMTAEDAYMKMINGR